MPKKTYTREVITLFSKDELSDLLKQAHEHCKSVVKAKGHYVGKKRKRRVITRPRAEYQACIKRFIEEKIREREQQVVGAS